MGLGLIDNPSVGKSRHQGIRRKPELPSNLWMLGKIAPLITSDMVIWAFFD